MAERVRVLLISGSVRARSTNSAVLRTAAALATAAGIDAVRYEGLAALPAFDPDADVAPRPAPVRELLDRIHRADAIVFSTPEYAGALPGAFKNLLDWLIGDNDPRSVYNKPVAWINASPRGAALAHDSLRAVLGYAHADIVQAVCVNIPVTPGSVDLDGLIDDPAIRDAIEAALHALAAHVTAPHSNQ
ncbi:MAG TPA: NADPH-dependent FMN reductase [Acidimicrobiia bacterium]